MTIVFTPDGGGSAVNIAGAESDGADGPSGMEGGAQIRVQQDDIIGATVPARFARGNQVVTISLQVRKSHASYEDAHAYWLAHLVAFSVLGTVVLTQGAAVLTLTAADVVPRGKTTGATSEWSYQITGVVS